MMKSRESRLTRLETLEATWDSPVKEITLQVQYTDALDGAVEWGPQYTYVFDPHRGWCPKGDADEIA